MKNKKSIILVIVEGLSDKDALYPWLSIIGKEINVRFKIMHGDPFSNRKNINDSSLDIIDAILSKFQKISKLTNDDILAIFQLTDTDGVFIPNENVLIDQTITKLKYDFDKIFVKDIEHRAEIIQRNEQKSNHLTKLAKVKFFRKSIYQIYYFSRNLDAVVHNNADLQKSKKISHSEMFSDSFINEIEFANFFSSGEFAVTGDYNESWDFITQGCNSLNRYSNFHLLLASLKSLLEGHGKESS